MSIVTSYTNFYKPSPVSDTMAKIKAKGHEFEAFHVRDSFNRRAVQFRNNIANNLRKIGLTEDDIEVPMGQFAIKKAPASASWYIGGCHLYYSYGASGTFVENLYAVSKVIELEVEALLNERKTLQEFIGEFTEDKDIENKRKDARKVLGLSDDSSDMEIINEKYKLLAKEHHPDMPNGDMERFKTINNAHKTLRRELE